ncbi:MAG: chromate transporter [Clostridia bacterium]|nr:chromate transporter [Clostridia bacterium]
MKRFKILWQLYWAFLRIGGLTFGGGLAMLPMLKYELVEKKGWITEEELIDCYAIGQCTPGIIAINTATFVGYKSAGILGGIFSTLGMVTPSLVIITAIATCLEKFMYNEWLQHALAGIRGVVCALMVNTVYSLGKKSLKNLFGWILCLAVFAVCVMTNIPTVVMVIVSAVIGILIHVFRTKKEANKA